MTERQPSSPTTRSRSRRRSLYRTVLGLAVAALVAASLPFSVLYATAVNVRPTPVAVIGAPHASGGTTRVVTTASGATRVVPATASAGATATQSAAPITTRVS
jgi:hypothetical protein